jgi:hypothetical protein
MAAKLTILTHKIAIKLHLVAESYTICSSRSRQPVRKLLYTPSLVRVIKSRWLRLAVYVIHVENKCIQNFICEISSEEESTSEVNCRWDYNIEIDM